MQTQALVTALDSKPATLQAVLKESYGNSSILTIIASTGHFTSFSNNWILHYGI